MSKIALVQANFTVGALAENSNKLLNSYKDCADKSDLVIYPELGILGYPPEDLLFSKNFIAQAIAKQEDIVKATLSQKAAILFGGIEEENGELYNVAIYASDGKTQQIIRKNSLPNYGVFDEKRFFAAAKEHQVIELNNLKYLVLVCEDLWQEDLMQKINGLDFQAVLVLNASPYTQGKLSKRIDLAKQFGVPVYYNNLVGGQDSLVFDGNSFVLDGKGKLVKLLAGFKEDVCVVEDLSGEVFLPEQLEENYQALMLGLKDYLHKNGAKSVILGLSGGADSALVAAIACDALGADKVNLVTMPSRFTSKESFSDADALIANLECVNFQEIEIEGMKDSFLTALEPSFAEKQEDLTEENLQARIRGVLLMALSNKFGHMVLATSNKSEAAMGYATLYGDMCGAYGLIKDVYKTEVYKLIEWRNKNVPSLSLNPVSNPIPENIIHKAPTAELRDDQKDSDSLPEYEVLDKIIYGLIEERKSVAELVVLGFAKDDVEKANRLLRISEYKRYQAAPGPKISELSFDKERRIPLTNYFENA